MTGSDLPVLSGDLFYTAGLTNLQRLYLRSCNIEQIHKQAFNRLKNLIELDLAENKLHVIPSQAFFNVPRLNTLTLSENPFKEIPHGSFTALTGLLKLDLSNSQIKSLVSGAFAGLSKLERLYLHGNRLENIEYPDEVLPALNELRLHSNPWRCDCHMKDLRMWLDNSQENTAKQLKCRSPQRLAGIMSKSVDLSQFACRPTISPPTMYLSIPEEKKVSLTCQIDSSPLARVWWTFNNAGALQSSNDVTIIQEILRHNKMRSVLTVMNVDGRWNGTFACYAENNAGRTIANYTVDVTSETVLPRILDLKLEYFVIVAFGALFAFVLVTVSITLACIITCRKKLGDPKKEEFIHYMPRKIKMGTSPTRRLDYRAPDIISDISQTLYQTQMNADSSCFSIDTATTPISLSSSTNAILQPSKLFSETALEVEHNCVEKPNLKTKDTFGLFPCQNASTGLRREWFSMGYFIPPTQYIQQTTKYPSDFGLPRMPYHDHDQCMATNNRTVSNIHDQNMIHKRDIAFNNFSSVQTCYPQKLHVKSDEKYPDHFPTDPTSLVYQDHLYTQIPSLTPSGYDHQYESLHTIYQNKEKYLNVWETRRKNEDALRRNQSTQELDNCKRLSYYQKSLSLPILDDVNIDDDYGGETEI